MKKNCLKDAYHYSEIENILYLLKDFGQTYSLMKTYQSLFDEHTINMILQANMKIDLESHFDDKFMIEKLQHKTEYCVHKSGLEIRKLSSNSDGEFKNANFDDEESVDEIENLKEEENGF